MAWAKLQSCSLEGPEDFRIASHFGWYPLSSEISAPGSLQVGRTKFPCAVRRNGPCDHTLNLPASAGYLVHEGRPMWF